MEGTVFWFNKNGFGIVKDTHGRRYFIHHTSMDDETSKAASSDAFEGKRILFDIEHGATPGRKTATDVHFA